MIKLVYVGRFSTQKNNIFLLDLTRQLNADCINYSLDIYGDAELGDNAGQVIKKKILNELKYNQRIKWHGTDTNVRNELSRFDCLLLPSRWEGWPMVMVEAASAGCVPICSDIKTGPREFLIEQINYGIEYNYPVFGSGGILLSSDFDSRSVVQWSNVISLLDADKGFLNKCKQKSYTHSLKFSFAAYKNAWKRVVNDLHN